MKDLGEASYILEIKVYKNKSKRILGLSQKLYIEKVLKRFSIENSKKGLLPLRHGINLFKMMCLTTSEEVQCMSNIPYVLIIRSLMYVILYTRPNIVLTVSVTSRYQSNPGVDAE